MEALLLQHPAIADAAVVGIPDEVAGEVPKGFVVKKGQITEKEILDYISGNYSKINFQLKIFFFQLILCTKGLLFNKPGNGLNN